jgi:hypothetical protein
MLLPLQANQLRILELRDRIRTGPAPFLYAQLAEEYRRAGVISRTRSRAVVNASQNIRRISRSA